MKNLKNVAAMLLNDESGQDLIEYALVAGLISLAAITALGLIKPQIGGLFTNISTSLTSAA